MATYKVIQDIEAEDTIIGWMTPRQAIYAAIVIVSGFIWFMMAANGLWWLGLIFLPHIILFTVLAGPFVHDQPSEVWLLAKIQFFLKPRRRIWDQSGLKELVKITVPKKIERQLTDGLSQMEVKSRLQALANTIDSRGWAVKNINTNLYAQPSYALAGSDRLIDTSTLPREVPSFDVQASDDILDATSNPTAQNLRTMVTQSAQAHRQQLMQQMQQQAQVQAQSPAATADYWFMNQNTQKPIEPIQSATPTKSDEEILKASMSAMPQQATVHSNLRVIEPLKPEAPTIQQATPQPAVVSQLAQNNDLNIATIARQANLSQQPKPLDDNEVVVSLR